MITRVVLPARVQASVLSLYDTNRLTGPKVRNDKGKHTGISWAEVDAAVTGKLNAGENTAVRILTGTVVSPSTKEFCPLY